MMKIVSIRPAKVAVYAAAANSSKAAAAPAKTLKALNITKSNLVNSQGGSTTRNVDGIVYTINYSAEADKVTVIDRVNRFEYDAEVGEGDNRISLVFETARALPGPPSFEQLQSMLKGNGPGPEIINGRVAMAGFTGGAIIEIISGQPFLAQLATPAGATSAAALAVLITAASVAPTFTGKVTAENVFPSVNDSYPNSQLPGFWNPLAEIFNARAAMMGIFFLVLSEHLNGKAFF